MIVIYSPDQLTVSNSLQILDALFLFYVGVDLLFKLGLSLLQFFSLLLDNAVQHSHVINQFTLVVFGKFFSIALKKNRILFKLQIASVTDFSFLLLGGGTPEYRFTAA